MKKITEDLKIGQGLSLQIERRMTDKHLLVTLALKSKKKCVLHWGVCRNPKAPWQLPPEHSLPPATTVFSHDAAHTPFVLQKGEGRIHIELALKRDFSVLSFVLFFPLENSWDNNHGNNFSVRLPQAGESLLSPAQTLAGETSQKQVVFQQSFALAGRELAAVVMQEADRFLITLLTDISGPLVLHWGVAEQSRYEWKLPAKALRPTGTIAHDERAVQTHFVFSNGLNRLQLAWQEDDAVLGLTFVMLQTDQGEWLTPEQGNFFIPVKRVAHEDAVFETGELADLADEIIQKETGRNSWTLMHRFNLCHDLLDRVGSDLEAMALVFVWLRYSAIRQLDWQRNYNTQPRELSHAQKRLTLKLATVYRDSGPAGREIIRLALSTVGRGGEGGKGQRIRDEILQIMHRHRIKEVTGHFMEEWHQKLHNNATPDDIVICEAYLAFLYNNGDVGAFYDTLSRGGVTKARLESFERPIVTDPDFAPHIRDGLIHDFEKYLQLLKSVYSATDLFSAVQTAEYCLDDRLQGRVWNIYNGRDDNWPTKDYLLAITDVRRALMDLLGSDLDEHRTRAVLYLDLALEEFLRLVVERTIHRESGKEHLMEIIGLLMENLLFVHADDQLNTCCQHWRRLSKKAGFDREWALHARSVLDRVTRALGSFIDYYDTLLQPKAEHLGNAFQAEDWTIELFNQEVVRGSSAYVLSLLLRHIDPILREVADLGNWQIISHNDAAGCLEIADLSAVQGKKYKRSTVILTDRVRGEEEVPEGVVAVITGCGVDILSHVSVRARNADILFATCYEPKIIDELKSCKGQSVKLTVTPAGDVEFVRVKGKAGRKTAKKITMPAVSCRPVSFASYAVAGKEFTDKLVGGKSLQLTKLKGKLPAWMHLPLSVAVPFCVSERVHALPRNKALLKEYNRLTHELEHNPEKTLPFLRENVKKLNAPEELRTSLKKVMADEGLAWPSDWEVFWTRIKHVWASKWNERAYWSRKKWRLEHDKLHMAVLIQKVVDAEYAFVIHTAHPFSGNRNELYAEIVLGLGETICSGNYPGRALSFTCVKGKRLHPSIVSYPGKSLIQKGSGLIIRSDSNGEDLDDYAGAGLYDSVLLDAPLEKYPDYVGSPLLWQEEFRKKFLRTITKIGIEVENIMGGVPQDIEGAYAAGRFYIVQTRPQVGV